MWHNMFHNVTHIYIISALSNGILAKEMKTRQDSLTEFEKAGREDLISHVKEEIAVLQKYMPAQMTEGEIRDVVKKAIAECGDNVNINKIPFMLEVKE